MYVLPCFLTYTFSYRNGKENYCNIHTVIHTVERISFLPVLSLTYTTQLSFGSICRPDCSQRNADKHFQRQIVFSSLASRYATWVSSARTHYQLILRNPRCLNSPTYSGMVLWLLCPCQFPDPNSWSTEMCSRSVH